MFSSQESTATTAYSSFSLPDLGDEHLSSQSTVQQSQTIINTAPSMPVGEFREQKIDARSSVTEDTPSEESAAKVPVQSEKKVDASIVHTTDVRTYPKNCTELIPSNCSIDRANLRHSIFPIGKANSIYEISARSCRSS